MKDFESLLDAVLQEDARVEPLAGMESRMMAQISTEARPLLYQRLVWSAVAASIALAITQWSGFMVRVEPNRPSTITVARAALITPDNANLSRVLNLAVVHGMNQRVRSKKTRFHATASRTIQLKIKPLVIAPLLIQPLEVASLSTNERRGRGEFQ